MSDYTDPDSLLVAGLPEMRGMPRDYLNQMAYSSISSQLSSGVPCGAGSPSLRWVAPVMKLRVGQHVLIGIAQVRRVQFVHGQGH